MSQMNRSDVWYEMARRKVQFHKKENWADIKLWGLFNWGNISHLLKTGELITDMKKENRTIWVRPSQDVWENKIEPLIKRHSLKKLTALAGW